MFERDSGHQVSGRKLINVEKIKELGDRSPKHISSTLETA